MAPVMSRMSPPPGLDPPEAPERRLACPCCLSLEHGELKLCAGMGQVLQNYNWWYRRCPNCDFLDWHTPATPIDAIPEEIRVRFALLQSTHSPQPKQARDSTILCKDHDCLQSKNQPRRANKDCSRDPPRCANCCRKGPPVKCKAHGVFPSTGISSLPSTFFDPSIVIPASTGPSDHSQVNDPSSNMKNVSTSPSPSPSPKGTSSTPVVVRSYARPLSEGYGNSWFEAQHLKLQISEKVEESRHLDSMLENKVTVRLWLSRSEDMFHINVSNRVAGKFVLAEHEELVDELTQWNVKLIEVYSMDEAQWVKQTFMLPVPVPVGRNAHVLIRVPGVPTADCFGFEDELALMSQGCTLKRPRDTEDPGNRGKSRKTSAEHTAGFSHSPDESGSVGASVNGNVHISPHHAGSAPPSLYPPDLPPPAAANVKTFPFVYVCDMQLPMNFMEGIRDEVPCHFASAFRSVPFISSTFYKHRNIYQDACAFKIIDSFAKKGRVPDGKWSALVHRIKELQCFGLDSTAQDSPVISTPSPTGPFSSGNSPSTEAADVAPFAVLTTHFESFQ
ncbi:hypothetical protein JAAARDRAFT_200106 [Jaapia argillacea MUCL 33604]|uniref:Uncharacterized protein n=1 Tax=Jaapia argillacea MUCL 33604 TaxID=933084 RepID=A0A067P5Z9_9AGAM|nr:hypothetical protein JAAARDRAFT_200106 [Jaapia argillacea MUCL 33604]